MNVPIEFCAWLIGDIDTDFVEDLYSRWTPENTEVHKIYDYKTDTK
jgi:hypothetical protein